MLFQLDADILAGMVPGGSVAFLAPGTFEVQSRRRTLEGATHPTVHLEAASFDASFEASTSPLW